MKHPHEISLHLKEQRIKKESECNQCMFTQVDEINASIMELSDRLDQLPTASDIFIWNKKLGDTREILDENFKRYSDMINELKGVVSMARASIAERKECDVKNSNKEKCCNVTKNSNSSYHTLKVLASENALLRKVLEETQEKLNEKKWWKFWE